VSLRVGIVGFGEIASYHARHLANAGAEVVGVVTSRSVPAGLTKYDSFSAMLYHVDAVTIAVPNHLHAALCIQAVEAGIPVFVEKPLCITDGELSALEYVLPRAPRAVHVGFRLRWNPWIRALRRQITEARRVRCIYHLGIDRLAAGKEWTRRHAESGGAFCALGVHALDLARWLAGAGARPLENLTATATNESDAADFPLLVGMTGRIAAGPIIDAGADLRGDGGFALEVAVDDATGTVPLEAIREPRPEDAGAPEAEYGSMLRFFVQAAHRGPSPPDDIAEILQCHRDLLMARTLAERTPE
jgi:predicted dehydrogenase